MSNCLSKINEAYTKAAPTREILSNNGCRCMEVTEDKQYGILWERWIAPGGRSIIVYATPHWSDVFCAVSQETKTEAYNTALREFLKQGGEVQ